MTVLRVHKKETNFLILDKTCLTQQNLSWGAKGLHSYLMSLPSDWRVNVYDLKKRATNGRDSVRGLLSELEKAGYIIRESVRNEETGKFGGIEYVVYEIPQEIQSDSSSTESPAPGKPSAVEPRTENPETGFQAPVNPAPEKATLVSIKNNKYPENKITAAAREEPLMAFEESETKKAAAAFSEQKTQPLQNTPSRVSFINPASPEDSVIANALTPYQQERLESLLETVSNQGFHVTADEIEYCLLNPQNFKNSGQDFGRKLNAIRTVILRGEWQTPVWMILEKKIESEQAFSTQRAVLSSTQAEINHFQRLLESAHGTARENILDILAGAQKKMDELKKTSNQKG